MSSSSTILRFFYALRAQTLEFSAQVTQVRYSHDLKKDDGEYKPLDVITQASPLSWYALRLFQNLVAAISVYSGYGNW